ncbi:hypothetical protein LJC45_04935 [Alistipes sp. OttesenSCG-928-B03]|nr:hypothetical protein [Alistipes sp. OttesenSCG-928-B03]
MKHKNNNQKEWVTATLLAIATPLGIGLIIVIAIFKGLFTKAPDPLDNDVNTSRRIVSIIHVVDTTYNGFKVVYTTNRSVSVARQEEIQSRPHIIDGFQRLKRDAPAHFGSMIQTDIYDFADFAIDYDYDDDVRMHNIYIYGKEKIDQYFQPNPKIPNSARWFNPGTEQGIQFIKQDDIYYRRRGEKRLYRYWKCRGLHATSSTDERWAHFSEDDRIW